MSEKCERFCSSLNVLDLSIRKQDSDDFIKDNYKCIMFKDNIWVLKVFLSNVFLCPLVLSMIYQCRLDNILTRNRQRSVIKSAWYAIIRYIYVLFPFRCVLLCHDTSLSLIARFMGPTWGPSGADRTHVGPMSAPWTLLSGVFHRYYQ